MLRIFYLIIKDFGGFGIGIISILINGFLFWKLFTNHLHHLQKAIKSNGRKTSVISGKLTRTNKEVINISERVATIEGRCGAYHDSKDLK